MEIQDERAVKDFRELNVWQKAHQLTLAVSRIIIQGCSGRVSSGR